MSNQTPNTNQSKRPSFGGAGGGHLPLPRRGSGGGFLIVIVGPTAIGKTSLSIALAQHFDCEILSADSRQFYKEMSIGTAVPSKDELAQAKHHFIHHINIHRDYSVGDFERDAIAKLNQIYQKNDLAILVGGSGLYIDAVVNGLDVFPEVDQKIREQLSDDLEKKGLEYLQNLLLELDPESYNEIAIDNPRRVLRALEVCISSGKKFSSFKNHKKVKRNFTPLYIGLTAEREIIYQRIEKRVDSMIQQGLLEEAKALFPYRYLNALQTVGYRELFTYLEGKTNLEFAVSDIKKNTRRFAKRQLTWFKRDNNLQWFDFKASQNEIVSYIDNMRSSNK